MSGVKYLLDTNVILGMLKSTPEILAMVGSTGLMAQQCAFSAVTAVKSSASGGPGAKHCGQPSERDGEGGY